MRTPVSLQGPIVVIADRKDAALVAALSAVGASPIIEASWRQGADAIARHEPAGIVASDPDPPSAALAAAVEDAIAAVGGPHLPVIARVAHAAEPPIVGALPMAAGAAPERVVTRLVSAQRVRTLHVIALRRADALKASCSDVPVLPASDPLDDATVIVTGRGRGYPGLLTAVGARVGLLGALSVEIAAEYLNVRDVDGIVIGEGFNPRTVEALLNVLAEDSRLRELPIALVPPVPPGIGVAKLPNLERIAGEPADVVARILPLVRQHAFEARLQRQLAALETRGLIDPQTGLFTIAAFLRDLNRAVDNAKLRGNDLTLARFTFPASVDRRANMDAARLVSRLVRSVDFACRGSDGSILLVFAETALRSAHIVARRIASVLRHTMLVCEGPGGKAVPADPTITLAVLKATDTIESLLGRVSEPPSVAAQ